MPTVDVVDLNNEKVGELELADAVFGAEVNDALLYEAVRHYQACERAGTHKTKVRRRSRRLRQEAVKQKGTGRARVGSIRSPIWRHGGTRTGRGRAITVTNCRTRWWWVRCARRFPPKCATAN